MLLDNTGAFETFHASRSFNAIGSEVGPISAEDFGGKHSVVSCFWCLSSEQEGVAMETEQKIEEVPQADQASDEPLSSGEEEEEKKEKKEKKKSKKRKEKGSGSEDEGSASGEEQEKKKSKKNKPEKQKNDQGEVFFDVSSAHFLSFPPAPT